MEQHGGGQIRVLGGGVVWSALAGGGPGAGGALPGGGGPPLGGGAPPGGDAPEVGPSGECCLLICCKLYYSYAL